MHCTARAGIEFTIPQVQIADLTHSLTLQGTGLLKIVRDKFKFTYLQVLQEYRYRAVTKFSMVSG